VEEKGSKIIVESASALTALENIIMSERGKKDIH
jgi:hypothetical protein